MIRRDDTIYLSNYARDNDLIEKPRRKQLQRYVKNTNNTNCLLKSTKAKQIRNTVRINFGMDINRENKEAMMFDSDNGNTNWKDTELLELKKI